MKKIIIFTIIFILMIFFLNTTNTYASILGDTILGGKNFISSGTSGKVSLNENELQKTSENIYDTLLLISFLVVAVIGISLGIKFMMSGVEEKADVKKSLVVFVIGCVVTYGAFGIWRVIVTFFNTL